MNNLKMIREIYGATQEQIAEAIGVNRVTVANWEIDASVASNSNREKLSIYYGIGPEYFYEKELNDEVKKMLQDTAAKAVAIVKKSNGKRNKEQEFHNIFESLSFAEAMNKYMFSMKLMLATADKGDLDKLRTAVLINEKMGKRLQAIIDLRESEQSNGEPSLEELLKDFASKE